MNPSCNQKGKNGNPPPKAGAPEFYPNNESERRCGLENEKPQGLSLQPEGESSMDRRRLTDAAVFTLAG